MKITFILPPYKLKPSGGYAVIYEYANQLVSRGHEVTVVHARRYRNIRFHPLIELYLWVTGISRRFFKPIRIREVPWYLIDSRVKILDVPELTASYVPDGDAIFNNRFIAEYPREKGKEFLLITGYGTSAEQSARANAAWREPIGKVMIARWLYERGLKLGVPADEMVIIPIGIDHSIYRILVPIEDRPPRIAMLYHKMPIKGAVDGIKALELARRRNLSLEAVLFGIYPRPKMLPDWIEYHCGQPREELVGSTYNGSSIYLCPSWKEGWHLPPAEAMACGCAVVSTDIGGVRDYAEHGVTALLSPSRDPEGLAYNIVRLLKDDELRVRLAKAGHERIKEFTWERSTDLLEQYLMDRIGQPGTQEKS